MPDLGAESVNCWAGRDDEGGGNTGDDMLVMASAAKSGAVLSARLVVEVRSPHGNSKIVITRCDILIFCVVAILICHLDWNQLRIVVRKKYYNLLIEVAVM
jgi:hypothetical protein